MTHIVDYDDIAAIGEALQAAVFAVPAAAAHATPLELATLAALDPRTRNVLMWCAANRGLWACAHALLAAGAHPETTLHDMPVLWMLSGAGSGAPPGVNIFGAEHASLCAELLRRGAHVDALGRGGRTALDKCARFGYVEAVRFLLAHGARTHGFNAVFEAGNAPLHGAANEGRVEIVRLLLAAGASAQAPAHDGRTPLHAAAAAARAPDEDVAATIDVLLAAGACRAARWLPPDYARRRGATPLQVARHTKQDSRILQMLEC